MRINMIPSQKAGMAHPMRDKTVMKALETELGRWATMTPVNTPTAMATNIEVRMRRAVAGIFSRINSSTAFPWK